MFFGKHGCATSIALGVFCLGVSYGRSDILFLDKTSPPIQNRSFEKVEARSAEDAEIQSLLKAGWKLDPANYPWHWRLNPAVPGSIEVVKGTAHTGERCVKLGGDGHLYYIFGAVKKNARYRASVWARGKGTLTLALYLYGEKGCFGQENLLTATLTDEWKQYSAEYTVADPKLQAINPAVTAMGPECYLDDYDFVMTDKGEPIQ